MMSLKTWEDETTRGFFTPRSKLLKAIGTALTSYHTAPAGGTIKLTALKNALLAWIQKKGNGWRHSTRNTTKVGNKGTVERLLDDVFLLNAAYKNEFNAYLNAATAPVVAILGTGNILRQKDADDKWFEIPAQNKEYSCGPCSIRIVNKLVNGSELGEDILRQYVEAAEEGMAYVGSMGTGGAVSSDGVHDWGAGGGGTWLVPAALKNLRPQPQVQDPAQLTVIQPAQTALKKPAVTVVEWADGSLHYVVVAGALTKKPNTYRVLDPFYGIQELVTSATGVPQPYRPIDPQTKAELAVGDWHPWVCRVL